MATWEEIKKNRMGAENTQNKSASSWDNIKKSRGYEPETVSFDRDFEGVDYIQDVVLGKPSLDKDKESSAWPMQKKKEEVYETPKFAVLPEEYATEVNIPPEIPHRRFASAYATEDAQSRARWNYLARLDTLTRDEKEEAKAAVKELRGGNLLQRAWKNLTTLRPSEEDLQNCELADVLEKKYNVASSVASGFADSIPFFSKIQNDIRENTKEVLPELVSDVNPMESAIKANPTAAGIGEMAGNLTQLIGGGATVKAGTGLNKGFSSLAPWVQSAINTGLTFGAKSGLDTASEGGSIGQIAANTGIGALGGVAGSVASGLVGEVGTKALFRFGLQNSIPAEVIRNGISSAAFAAGNTGSTYLLYPEDYRPSGDQVAKDMVVAFAFGAITSGLQMANISKANKAYIDNAVKEMQAEYARTFSGAMTNAEKAAAMGKVLALNSEIRTAISQNRYIGQEQYIDDILDGINAIDDQINIIRSGLSAAPTEPQTIQESIIQNGVPAASETNGVSPEGSHGSDAAEHHDKMVSNQLEEIKRNILQNLEKGQKYASHSISETECGKVKIILCCLDLLNALKLLYLCYFSALLRFNF